MCYAAGKSCTSNLHKNIEILHFTKGCGSVLCGENSYDVQPGDVVVVNSYLAHRVDAKENIVYDCLIIYDDFCAENGIDTALTQFDAKLTDSKVFALFQKVLDQYNDQSPLWQARVRHSALELLICLCAEHSCLRSSPITEDQTFQSVIGAISYMKENLKEFKQQLKKAKADSEKNNLLVRIATTEGEISSLETKIAPIQIELTEAQKAYNDVFNNTIFFIYI